MVRVLWEVKHGVALIKELEQSAQNGPQRMDAVTGRYCLKQIIRLKGATCLFTLARSVGFPQLDHGPHVF